MGNNKNTWDNLDYLKTQVSNLIEVIQGIDQKNDIASLEYFTSLLARVDSRINYLEIYSKLS